MPLIDRLSGALGRLSAWGFAVIGLMLIWEVGARYFFTAPTIWAAELAQLIMVWAVFLGMAQLLRDRADIRVTVLTDQLGADARRIARGAALVAVLAVSFIVVWRGIEVPFDSLMRGRRSGTMLDLPAWPLQAAAPLGFALLGLQALAELLKLRRAG